MCDGAGVAAVPRTAYFLGYELHIRWAVVDCRAVADQEIQAIGRTHWPGALPSSY